MNNNKKYDYKYKNYKGKTIFVYEKRIKKSSTIFKHREEFFIQSTRQFQKDLKTIETKGLNSYITKQGNRIQNVFNKGNFAIDSAKAYLNSKSIKRIKSTQRILKIKNPLKRLKSYENYLNRELSKRSTFDLGDISRKKPKTNIEKGVKEFQKIFYSFKNSLKTNLTNGGYKEEIVNKILKRFKPLDYLGKTEQQLKEALAYVEKEQPEHLDPREIDFYRKLKAESATTFLKSIHRISKYVPEDWK